MTSKIIILDCAFTQKSIMRCVNWWIRKKQKQHTISPTQMHNTIYVYSMCLHCTAVHIFRTNQWSFISSSIMSSSQGWGSLTPRNTSGRWLFTLHTMCIYPHYRSLLSVCYHKSCFFISIWFWKPELWDNFGQMTRDTLNIVKPNDEHKC